MEPYSLTAGDYADQFHKVTVTKFDVTGDKKLWGKHRLPMPITEYCNSKHATYLGKTYKERTDWKNLMGYTFLPKLAGKPGSGITGKDGFYSITCCDAPVYDLTISNINSAIGGKASLGALKKVVELISFWRSWETLIEKKKMDPLEDLVAQYVGMDCNGFVGNYLKQRFPTLQVDPNNPEEMYYDRAVKDGIVRKHPMEVRGDDIIVFPGHIAMVSEVIIADHSSVLCRVSEARTAKKRKGGVQTNSMWIYPKKKSTGWELGGHERVASSIVRLKGM